MAIIPPRRNEALTKNGSGTTRFHEYLERSTTVLNATESAVEGFVPVSVIGAIARLQEIVGSGDPLTWDTDSFTWDSTEFTFDMDEA